MPALPLFAVDPYRLTASKLHHTASFQGDRMRRLLTAFVLGATLCAMAQTPPPADSTPKLEKFDPTIIDKSKDPCQDFYAYTCSKWTAAHPIPPDLGSNGTGTPLYLYNQTILRDTLVKAAANKSATGSERQIGD